VGSPVGSAHRARMPIPVGTDKWSVGMAQLGGLAILTGAMKKQKDIGLSKPVITARYGRANEIKIMLA